MKKLALLVDDDAICNSISKILLKKKFANEFEITAFVNPVEGLKFLGETLEENKYQQILILLDINMPVLTGWEFLEEYKKLSSDKKNVTIYILTSSVSKTDIEKAKQNENVTDFISKPITAATVEKLYKEVHHSN